jgi:hypothetical protein
MSQENVEAVNTLFAAFARRDFKQRPGFSIQVSRFALRLSADLKASSTAASTE